VDGAGAAYVTGYTESTDFPTTAGAWDTGHSGYYDAFVVKVNAAGSGLAYATFLGGSDYDDGYGIAVDGAGAAYVTGWTSSADFPTTAGAWDTGHNGDLDAFVVKMNADGSGLLYGTFLGGSLDDYGCDIAVDGAGAAYVTGYTWSADFPTTAGAWDTGHNGVPDAVVVQLNADGSGLAYATFLGGSDYDVGYGIAVDGAGAAYVTGDTYSTDFPTTAGAWDTGHNGGYDAFVVKLAMPTVSPTAITLVSFTAQMDARGVALAWETGTEIDNAGFNLYRATAENGPYAKVNDVLIAAGGDAVGGASYSLLDSPGYGTFYYKLEDVDYSRVSTLHGPVQGTVAVPFRRPLHRPFVPTGSRK